MGKGDQKSRRGKIQVGSFGVLRPRKKAKVAAAKAETAKAPAKKASTKKAAAK
jgi:30S ribosomal protein S31